MFVDKIKENFGSISYVIILGINGVAIRGFQMSQSSTITCIYDYNGQPSLTIPWAGKLEYIHYNLCTAEVGLRIKRGTFGYDYGIFPAKVNELYPRYIFHYSDFHKDNAQNDQKIEKLAHQFRHSGPFQRFWITDIKFNYHPPNSL